MDLPDGPQFSSQRVGDSVRLSLGGHWTVDASAAIEARADGLLKESAGARRVVFDLGRIVRLDTAGAWLIDRARNSLGAAGVLWMVRTGAGGGWVTMAGALGGAPVAGVCGAGPESGAHRSPWPRAIDLAERRGRPHTVQWCCWVLSVGTAIGLPPEDG